MKKKAFALGILCGAILFTGATATAAGITAEPTRQNIYVDGRQASMIAYNIAGSNYVKLPLTIPMDHNQKPKIITGGLAQYRSQTSFICKHFLNTGWQRLVN